MSKPARTSKSATPARVRRAAIETLEGRQLLSVAVPAGYVHVGTVSVSATSASGTNTPALEAGGQYFFKATGTHQLATTPATRLADAGSYEKTPGNWVAGTHLHVGSVSWGGAHDSSSEYGASYTATSDGPLHAYISDSFYGDNSGSLNLDVYRRVTLDSLTVSDVDTPGNAVTYGGGEGDHLYVLEKDGGSATVKAEAGISPGDGRSKVLWKIDGSGASTTSGTFASDPSITLTPGDREFTVNAGVDSDGDGTLASSEVTKSIAVTVVKVDFESGDASTFLNTKTSVGVTVTPASAASHVKLDIDQGASSSAGFAAMEAEASPITFDGGTFELTLSPQATQRVEVFGGNVYGETEGGQAPIYLMMDTSDQREEKSKPVDALKLSDWIGEKIESGMSHLITDTAPTQAANFLLTQTKDSLTFLADPANNSPRQADAQQALNYFNSPSGEDNFKNGFKSWWNDSLNNLKSGTGYQPDLELAWDKTNLTSLGAVKGLRAGDQGGPSVSVTPVFNPQSVNTVLDNLGNIGDIASKPGLFISDLGAKFTVNGIQNTELSFELKEKWKSDQPAWEQGSPTAEVKLKILDVFGGTLNVSGSASYDIQDKSFSEYSAKVGWSIGL